MLNQIQPNRFWIYESHFIVDKKDFLIILENFNGSNSAQKNPSLFDQQYRSGCWLNWVFRSFMNYEYHFIRMWEYLYTCLAEGTFGSPHSKAFFSRNSKSALPAYTKCKYVILDHWKKIKYSEVIRIAYLYLCTNLSVETLISLTNKLR